MQKHGNHYNFEDSEDAITSFLNNVKSKFKPNKEVLIKSVFLP